MAISAKKRLTNDKYNAKCTQINIKPLSQEAAAIKAAAARACKGIFCKPCAPGCRQRGSRSPWAIRPARNP